MTETRELADVRRTRAAAKRTWRCGLCKQKGSAATPQLALAELHSHVTAEHPQRAMFGDVSP